NGKTYMVAEAARLAHTHWDSRSHLRTASRGLPLLTCPCCVSRSELRLFGGRLHLFGTAHRFINGGTEYGAEDRRHPEQPQLTDRPSANVDCHARASRGIHRCVGDGNADQMDQREAETNGQRREALRCTCI